MLSEKIDKIKQLKGNNYKRRLAATTQLLEVMHREGCEGYDKHKKEGNYLWAHKHPQSEGGANGTGRGGRDAGRGGGGGG